MHAITFWRLYDSRIEYYPNVDYGIDLNYTGFITISDFSRKPIM